MKTSIKDLNIGDKFVIVKKWPAGGRQNRHGHMDKYLGATLKAMEFTKDGSVINSECGDIVLMCCWYDELIDWDATNKLYKDDSKKEFTKSNLEDGYKVVYRNGCERYVSKRTQSLYGAEEFVHVGFSYFTDDLKFNMAYREFLDIIRVYDRQDNLIWERTEKSPNEIRKEEIKNQIKELVEEYSKL